MGNDVKVVELPLQSCSRSYTHFAKTSKMTSQQTSINHSRLFTTVAYAVTRVNNL